MRKLITLLFTLLIFVGLAQPAFALPELTVDMPRVNWVEAPHNYTNNGAQFKIWNFSLENTTSITCLVNKPGVYDADYVIPCDEHSVTVPVHTGTYTSVALILGTVDGDTTRYDYGYTVAERPVLAPAPGNNPDTRCNGNIGDCPVPVGPGVDTRCGGVRGSCPEAFSFTLLTPFESLPLGVANTPVRWAIPAGWDVDPISCDLIVSDNNASSTGHMENCTNTGANLPYGVFPRDSENDDARYILRIVFRSAIGTNYVSNTITMPVVPKDKTPSIVLPEPVPGLKGVPVPTSWYRGLTSKRSFTVVYSCATTKDGCKSVFTQVVRKGRNKGLRIRCNDARCEVTYRNASNATKVIVDNQVYKMVVSKGKTKATKTARQSDQEGIFRKG